MPSFARELEQTLHAALAEAGGRRHEYATLEHLLLALIEDVHASKVMQACGVDVGELKEAVRVYLDSELEALKVEGQTEPSPTSGFQRVIQRAILHVQSSGRDEVTGANVLVALFSERSSTSSRRAGTRSPEPTSSSPSSRSAKAMQSISCSSRT